MIVDGFVGLEFGGGFGRRFGESWIGSYRVYVAFEIWECLGALGIVVFKGWVRERGWCRRLS